MAKEGGRQLRGPSVVPAQPPTRRLSVTPQPVYLRQLSGHLSWRIWGQFPCLAKLDQEPSFRNPVFQRDGYLIADLIVSISAL